MQAWRPGLALRHSLAPGCSVSIVPRTNLSPQTQCSRDTPRHHGVTFHPPIALRQVSCAHWQSRRWQTVGLGSVGHSLGLGFVCILEQELSVSPWLPWNLLCRLGWAQPRKDLPASACAGIKGVRHYSGQTPVSMNSRVLLACNFSLVCILSVAALGLHQQFVVVTEARLSSKAFGFLSGL